MNAIAPRTVETIKDEIRKILSEQGIAAPDVPMAARIVATEPGADPGPVDLGIDSLDHVEVIMAVEDQYDLEIDDEVAEKLETVGALVRYVAEKTGTAIPEGADL